MTHADRLLVAVFASPVAEVLVRWGVELGSARCWSSPTAGRGPRGRRPQASGASPSWTPSWPGGTADVVVTDHHRDELGELLRDALARPARWIGVMGNPRHEGPHVAALTALGVPVADIARVHRPIGLDIGSRAPAEIAVSTLAGLLADRNGRSGGFAHAG